jgi:hypothetical protein
MERSKMMRILQRLAPILGFAFLFASAAGAQGTKFQSTLTGKDSVPVVETPAHGEASLQLGEDSKTMTFKLTVTDIDDISKAQIRVGPPGQEGPTVVWLYPSQPPAAVKKGNFAGLLAEGTLTAANLRGPLKGKTLANLVEQINAGKAYISVYTEKHPSGEIRGQIEPGELPH